MLNESDTQALLRRCVELRREINVATATLAEHEQHLAQWLDRATQIETQLAQDQSTSTVRRLRKSLATAQAAADAHQAAVEALSSQQRANQNQLAQLTEMLAPSIVRLSADQHIQQLAAAASEIPLQAVFTKPT